MKLKLAQRIAIKYYRTKFQLLSLFSPSAAAASAFELFCTPYSGKPRRKAPPVFATGAPVGFTSGGLHLRGWQWTPAKPGNRKVLIVHGFDSCSYRFDRYIAPLQQEGFEVAMFDAPGHGTSEGRTVNALAYSHAIVEAEKLFGPFDVLMGHSLGGLATALAFEQLPHQERRKLVLIAPTTETHSAIDNFFRFLQVPTHLRPHVEKVIETVGQNPISHYSVTRIVKEIAGDILWLHDESDFICPYSDTLPAQKLQLPNLQFFITKGLGHSGIYRNDVVFKRIMEFINKQ